MGWGETAWDEVVGDLYASAVDPEAAERLPGRLVAVVGGSTASVWRVDVSDRVVVGGMASTACGELIAAYQGGFYRHDPLGAALGVARCAGVVRGSEIIDDEDLAASHYYNEFGIRYDLFHMIGLLVPLGARMGVISVVRARAAGAFERDAAAALGRLLPHVAGAFRLREQIERQAEAVRAEALDAALEGLGVPALVVDGHGRVLRVNSAAEGLTLVREARRRGGQAISFAPWPGHERVAGLLADAAGGGAGGQFGLSHASGRWVGTVSPLPGPLARLGGFGRGGVLMVLRRVGVGEVAQGALAGLFGMTRAEAAVAAALAEGLSPGEIAAARGVKVSTVRTLLQRAQEKAECRDLRDLARVLVSVSSDGVAGRL